jgi:hypothetical protein
MIRVFIENLLLFLAPTLIYVAYVVLTRDAAQPEPGNGARPAGILDDAPFIWLFAAGAFLVIATLIAFGSYSGGKPGEIYVPAEMRDGHIEPSRKINP